ncbi:MAG TPA: FAD-binding oxidoreductase [Acidimicrobiales bacterium]|nr:FAD-binding oxidoreductase [Acidimicrobiales bacterium]
MIDALRDVVGAANALDDPEAMERYVVDWTGRFRGTALAVVRPATTNEVAAIVALCRDNGVAIVPQGGNTGLVGGAVPDGGSIVLSLERLTTIDPVDALAGQVTVGAGATLSAVQAAARAAGWGYGVDIAARDSATIGGNIATNAGGLRVLRYGDTRRQLVGVEFVTGAGEVVTDLSGTLRDNTGYHLPSLLCGSEGTLGVVTRARLRLVAPQPERATALLRFDSHRDACVAAESLRRSLPAAESIELFFDDGVRLVCDAFGLAPPFADVDGGYVLVEAADTSDPTPALAAAADTLGGVADVAVATDAARRAALWRYRELHTDAISRAGIPHKLDIAVPPGTVADFLDALPAVVGDATVIAFGHAGEAAIHVNVLGPAPDDDTVDDTVLRLVVQFGGSISAEHGIGRAKLRWLDLAQSPEEQALRARIKAAFDPEGIMNPRSTPTSTRSQSVLLRATE